MLSFQFLGKGAGGLRVLRLLDEVPVPEMDEVPVIGSSLVFFSELSRCIIL